MKNTKRKVQLIKLLEKFSDGRAVSHRDVLSALNQSEYEQYLESWDLEKQSRICDKPSEIKKYQKLLTRACLAYKKMDIYSAKPRHDIATFKRLVRRVDVTFATALEFIQEVTHSNADVRLWLDRDPFDDACLSPSPTSIPRVIGSKSPECLDKRKVPYPTYSKRQVKENALLMALERLDTSSKESFEAYLTFPKKRESHAEFLGFLV